jgi:hypothetical protein
MLDWTQIVVGGVGAGLGTWFGAWAAFGHERRDRERLERRKQGEALRRAMFILLSQRTLLSNMWRQHMAAFVDHPLRHVAMHPFFIAGEELPFDLDRLLFVMNTEDADLLNRLQVCNRRFRTILSAVDLRNALHLEGQGIIAERATGDGATEAELRTIVGPHRWAQLKDFTDSLFGDVQRALSEIDTNYKAIEAIAVAEYPEVKLFKVRELKSTDK